MSKDYWIRIEKKLGDFWKQGDEIICTRVFKSPDSVCQLCGYTPITWNHVLLNNQTKDILIVGSECVVNVKYVLAKLGSIEQIQYSEKYKIAAELINAKRKGTATVIPFPSRMTIKELKTEPEKFDYKTIKSILDSDLARRNNELFEVALDIWLQRSYYLYEGSEFRTEDDSEQDIRAKIRDWIEMRTEQDLEDFYSVGQNIHIDFFEEETSIDDLAPEGMGGDEIDWDSHKFD